ncbi:TolC family protein [Daejeonella rubra]|nr:TolC family protein [Daejeonella rubra]
MKRIKNILLSGIILFPVLASAQDTISISKKDIWQKVSEKNLQLRISEQDYKSAQADYRQSNALFLPDVSVSHTGTSTTNPLMAFGSKLNQEILTSSDFNPALLNEWLLHNY